MTILHGKFCPINDIETGVRVQMIDILRTCGKIEFDGKWNSTKKYKIEIINLISLASPFYPTENVLQFCSWMISTFVFKFEFVQII